MEFRRVLFRSQNVSRSQADILLPEAGGTSKTVAVAELQEQYTGYALFARTEARFDERAPDTKLSEPRAWFWGTLWQFWPIYSHVLLASILINCFAIASPLFIMNVYDRVVPNQAVETLWVLAAGVIIVFEIGSALGRGRMGQYVLIAVVAVSLNKKKISNK